MNRKILAVIIMLLTIFAAYQGIEFTINDLIIVICGLVVARLC